MPARPGWDAEGIDQDYRDETVGMNLWDRILHGLKGAVVAQVYSAWLQDTRCVSQEEDVVTVAVPTPAHVIYLQRDLARHIALEQQFLQTTARFAYILQP